ncbi:MAG: hypothetical protein KJ646_02570 [Nanoarchaeota archaeon]|nr:hypothetical protein [Nanoarchaeota archaeon]MBU4116457.1 hypothetical protein [Nanoarchaeota archaeon]
MAKTKKRTKTKTTTDKKVCYPCKTSDWIFPIAIIALVWLAPAVMWSKIVITVLAVLAWGSNFCPCRKKK